MGFFKKSITILCLFVIWIPTGISQSLTAQKVLQKSIKYHDPKGNWGRLTATLNFDQDSPDNTAQKRSRKAIFNQPLNQFKMEQTRGEETISRAVNGTECTNTFNGSTTFSEDIHKKYRLTCERAKMYRDYYSYLYGLPMKLKDPGTIIDSKVKEDIFQKKDCYSIRVTYDPKVGDDIWYFYFDKKTFALIGYRFYHEEAKNDGEYITLEGEETIGGIKMPKNRYWYYNKDDKYLGADLLLPEK